MIDWLLKDDAPGVQYIARRRLLGEDPASRKMRVLRKRGNDYPPVARMLERVDDAVALGNYRKYRGACWTLIFLAEMRADGRDRRVRRLVRHVLDAQLDNGGFSAYGPARLELVCLTANLLRALVHFGFGEDEAVLRGYERLAERILPHGGVPCIALHTCLHTSCKMTLPQTLRCVAAAPPAAPKARLKRLRALLVEQLLSVRVYRYVRPDVKEYRTAVRRRPKGMTERVFREAWLREHRYRDDQLVPKPGWRRFGFPRSYNSDILEAMLALAEARVKYRPVLDDPLDHIERKRGRDGRWRLDDSLNGKMLANIERKGHPSKWITLRAMIVLKHFGRLD